VRTAQPETLVDRPARTGSDGESQLLRGLRVLEMLTNEPYTASEIARSIGVNRSTSLRLMNELDAAGYVRRDERTKRYATRPERFYGFIANHPDHRDLTEIITPILTRLREDSGEAAMLGVPANGVMVYLAYFPSRHAVTVHERLGTTRPIHASALGKAYLSGLDAAALDVELGRLSYAGGTDRAARGPLELRGRVDAARARGYAIDREETFIGGSCVAAPATIGGALIGAIGISGPTSRLNDDIIAQLGARVVREAASLAAFGQLSRP
jgi:DNA-binding IclR family transcriptional regulator